MIWANGKQTLASYVCDPASVYLLNCLHEDVVNICYIED